MIRRYAEYRYFSFQVFLNLFAHMEENIETEFCDKTNNGIAFSRTTNETECENLVWVSYSSLISAI